MAQQVAPVCPAGNADAHHTVYTRWLTASAVTAWTASHQRRCGAGSSAVAASNQTANGSQIRSTSALLIPDRSAATIATAAARASATGPVATRPATARTTASRPATPTGGRSEITARRSAGAHAGPAASTRLARLAQTQYAYGRSRAMPW